MADALIEMRDVSFAVSGAELVKNISCEVAEKRRTMVLGANGAGKSILLRLMHGLIEPTTGDVLWKGAPNTPGTRVSQSMVFQRTTMLRRSVKANLHFAATACGFSGRSAKSKVDFALESAGISHLADRPARAISGGEAQKLAFARALVSDPEVILLDEPTSNLDPEATHSIEALIMAASERGIAVVMVTHSAGQARRLAQDVIFVHAGQIAEKGAAERVLYSPKSEAAKSWLDGGLYL